MKSMSSISLKLKIILVFVIFLIIISSTIISILVNSYNKTFKLISENTLKTADKAFNTLESSDVKMMSSTMEALLVNENIKKLFLEKDRDKLYQYTSPIFENLKKRYGITHWYFHNPEPEQTNFLRVHSVNQYGDVINRVTFQNSIKNKGFVSGKELGKTAFALRVVHPYYDNGNLIGYIELGEEIEHFFELIKDQTGYELGMSIQKKYIDEKEWGKVRESHGLKNNWEDRPELVIVGKTIEDENVIAYEGEVEAIPDGGMVLGRIKYENQVFIKGVFPIYDVGNRKVGVISVLSDITGMYNEMVRNVYLILGGSLIISLLIMLLFVKKVIRPFNSLIEAFEQLAKGDLTTAIKVNSKDEIGKLAHSFEQVRLELKDLIGKVSTNSSRVSETAKQLSAQAEETTSSATSNAAVVSEISATVDNLVENVQEVSNRASEANKMADLGRNNIDTVVTTMQEIGQSVNHVSTSVVSLNQAIKKIGHFVETINGIADETNLLALNAAIEAARAGEAGRGFSVVAEEVRKLAENSAHSAKEINNIISEVQEQSVRAVIDMEAGKDKVAIGDRVVHDVSGSFSAIIQLVQDLSQRSAILAESAEQVGSAVQNISAATEEQTAAMEEVTASTENLAKFADELYSSVAKFKI